MKALEAAKLACETSSWKLTNLQLQKILYIAHMLYSGRNNGEPLIGDEAFEAWDYGPVLPNIYSKASGFGAKPVGNVFHGIKVPVDDLENQVKTVQDAVTTLLKMDPFRLVEIVHEPVGAWAKHYRPGYKHIVIPQEDIQQEYVERFAKDIQHDSK